MVALAIVDGSPVCRTYLQSLVHQYADDHQEHIDTYVFTSAEQFLAYYEHNIDILIIDSELRSEQESAATATATTQPETDCNMFADDAGVVLAAHIRSVDDGVEIMFVSTSEIHAILGYQVGAQSFMLKPPQYHDFSAKLHECISRWHAKRDNTVVIASGSTVQRMLIDDIIYLSSHNHRTLLHTQTERIPIVCSLVKFEERIPEGSSLLRVNSGFIVNLKHVKTFEDNTMLLTNGDTVTVSRPRKADVKEAMRKYYQR